MHADQSQQSAAAKTLADQKVAFAKLDAEAKITLQKKIDAARAAEAAAKKAAAAKAAADAANAAQAASLQASISNANCAVSNTSSLTVVINKKHCLNPLSYVPPNLISVDGYLMRSEAASAMQTMMAVAVKAGLPFGLTSTYRSYQNQVTTYNNWVAVNGSAALADQVSARPGYSEHQTGLAADLKVGSCVLDCFGTTGQYKWLVAHAASYGFIERYPAGLTSITGYDTESWHWRYVGPTTAQDMKQKGIETLEEYFGISGGGY